MQPDDTDPADTPLLTVLRQFEAEGFTGQFQVAEGAILRCLTCHENAPARMSDANRMVRLEGASDPADMLAVIPVECSNCGTAGALVVNFGPEATMEEAELLITLERTPRPPDLERPHPSA